ncbi:S8 family peptidase [Burkholderia alba]|uniref:S8 family peptidase n=1 Tax=Burkholderia alba TaxID=2683677 RepID=UPI0038990FFB
MSVLASIAAALLAVSCGGGGGGGGGSSASNASPAPPAASAPDTPAASSPSPACAVAQAAASTPPSSGSTAPQALVDHLLVKLRSETASAGGGSMMAATNSASRIDAVIARVTGRLGTRDATPASAFAAASAFSGAIRLERTVSGGAALLSLGQTLAAADAATLARTFAADDDVAYAEPDLRLAARSVPTDPDYAQQWNLFDPTSGIDLPAAWSITTGSPGIVTAVLDTGYVPHPDLVGNLLPGYDFITSLDTGNNGHGRSADATDPGDWVTAQEYGTPGGPFYNCITGAHNSTWHGTQVAGIVGASANNGIGIAGVSWYGKILPVRVLGKCGGTTGDVVDAMRWAAGLPVDGVPANPHPARVINLSLGGTGPCGTTFQQAIDDVNAQGASVVVAVGNDGLANAQDTPANCQGVIAVGATDNTARRASYSNYGAYVTLSAPGSGILSTTNTGATTPAAYTYATNNGASLAAPQVAGVIGLMLATNPQLTPAQIAQRLTATARASPTTGASCSNAPPGAGILDAAAALRASSN